jgi:uncharacterized protein (TIGR03435 family)
MLRTLVLLCLSIGASAAAQSFEVATIKPSQPQSADRQISGFQTPAGGRLNSVSTSLRMMITFAYNVKDYQVSGGPGWANSEPYDITAKAAGNATPAQLRLMLQTLLTERFKLALRHETKEAPIYELVVAKGGPKIKEDTTSARRITNYNGRGGVMVQKASLADFAQLLGGSLTGRPVVDKTGLQSTYSFKLDFAPDIGEAGVSPDPNAPSLFTALQEQLGLRLQPAKGPVENLVIEGAERPSEN